MSRSAAGTHTLPSGNPVVSGTTIDATWANATMADFSTEITDSLSRSGKGPMLAPLELVAGSISAPSVSFDAETALGFYRSAANTLDFTQGAARKFRISSTGVFVNPTAGAALQEIVSADDAVTLRIKSGDSTADEGMVELEITGDVLTLRVIDDDDSDGQTLFSVDLADDAVITFGRALDWSAGAATTLSNLGAQAADADTAKTDVAQTWTATQTGTWVEIDDTTNTFVIDLDTAGNYIWCDLDDDNAVGDPSNADAGRAGFIFIVQDGSGGHTPSWHANWDFGDQTVTYDDTTAGTIYAFGFCIGPAGDKLVWKIAEFSV